MSLLPITVDIQRPTVTEDDGGGEAVTWTAVYSGLSVTVGYPDKSSVGRIETAGSREFGELGPGPLTRSDRVVFLDPWDGSVTVLVADRVWPNPVVGWLPVAMDVIAVRPYYDGGLGELQLDCDDVS